MLDGVKKIDNKEGQFNDKLGKAKRKTLVKAFTWNEQGEGQRRVEESMNSNCMYYSKTKKAESMFKLPLNLKANQMKIRSRRFKTVIRNNSMKEHKKSSEKTIKITRVDSLKLNVKKRNLSKRNHSACLNKQKQTTDSIQTRKDFFEKKIDTSLNLSDRKTSVDNFKQSTKLNPYKLDFLDNLSNDGNKSSNKTYSETNLSNVSHNIKIKKKTLRSKSKLSRFAK